MQTGQPPILMPTRVDEGQAPGLTYRIEGELVPVLHVRLDGTRSLFFEHHVVLWKDPALVIGMHQMAGAFKRIVAGMPIFMTETQSPGEVAFSRDDPGHVLSLHLPPGRSIYVREHQFLAATGGIDYTFTRVRGIGNMLFGGTGFFIDRFQAGGEEGVVWLHGYGNVFEKVLGPGEAIDVEGGGWVFRDETVSMQPAVYGLKTGIFGGSGQLVFNRFTGPGRVGIQSAYVHLPTEN
jgi:uncharacterized protein (AIM24 family)